MIEWLKMNADIAAYVTVLSTAAVAGIKWAVRVGGYAQEVHTIIKTYPQDRQLLEKIHSEVITNGGSSIKDQINKLEALHRIQWKILRIPTWVADSQGMVTEVSPELQKLLETPEDSLTGLKWVSSIALEWREKVRDEWASAVEDSRPFHMKFVCITPDGKKIPVIVHGFPILPAHGKCQGYFGHVEIDDESKLAS